MGCGMPPMVLAQADRAMVAETAKVVLTFMVHSSVQVDGRPEADP
jgi:hypothetical protein